MPVAFYAAWLPRSFTLNALVNITAASPPDICAFGDYLSSSSEKYASTFASFESAEFPKKSSFLMP